MPCVVMTWVDVQQQHHQHVLQHALGTTSTEEKKQDIGRMTDIAERSFDERKQLLQPRTTPPPLTRTTGNVPAPTSQQPSVAVSAEDVTAPADPPTPTASVLLGTETKTDPGTPTPSGSGRVVYATTLDVPSESVPSIVGPLELPDLEYSMQSTQAISDLETKMDEAEKQLRAVEQRLQEATNRSQTEIKAVEGTRDQLQAEIRSLRDQLARAKRAAKVAWPQSFGPLSRKSAAGAAAAAFFKQVIYVIQQSIETELGSFNPTADREAKVSELQTEWWRDLFETSIAQSDTVSFQDLQHFDNISRKVWAVCRTASNTTEQQAIMKLVEDRRVSLGLPSLMGAEAEEKKDVFPSGNIPKPETIAQARRAMQVYSGIWARLLVLRQNNYLGQLVYDLVLQAYNATPDPITGSKVVSLVDLFPGVDGLPLWGQVQRVEQAPRTSGIIEP